MPISLVNAQSSDSLNLIIEDGYIEKINNKMVMDLSLNNSFETFEVKVPGNRYVIYPNKPNNLRFKFNYRFITFSFQFAPKFLPGNGDEELKGKTKTFEIGPSLIFRHWFLNLEYSKVRGYYLENTDDWIDRQKGDPYVQFPDLQYNGFSINSGYINNGKFSFRSVTSQTERQLKSTGSFMPAINVRYYIMDETSGAVNSQKSNNFEVSIGPGYAYTFVVKQKYYFSLDLQGTLGYIDTRLTTRLNTGDYISKQDNFIYRWDGRAGLGYNGVRFYSGLFATISGTQYHQENTAASNFETRISYHLSVGMRIKSPALIERQVDKIEKKIPKF